MSSRIARAIDTNIPPLDRENDPWEWWRSQMPIADKWAYFDHSAVAPLPVATAAAIREYSAEAAENGDVFWPQWDEMVGKLRRGWEKAIGAAPGQVAMIPNTTFGINVVAEGIEWREGDNVVIPSGEFPSNRFPWLHQRDLGVEVREIAMPSGPFDIDAFLSAIDDRTRVVSFSWVAYDHGTRAPITRLTQAAKERGALVMLDAIQALGVFPIDVSEVGVDCLAADGHKWLLGPEGAGVMYLSTDALQILRCRTVGWGSARNRFKFDQAEFEISPTASRYEGGSANICGLLGFFASSRLFWRVNEVFGPDAIANRVLKLALELAGELERVGAEVRFPFDRGDANDRETQSGIVNFTVPGMSASAVREAALEKNCVVSCRGGGVRASVHCYNNSQDIGRLIDVVRQLKAA